MWTLGFFAYVLLLGISGLLDLPLLPLGLSRGPLNLRLLFLLLHLLIILLIRHWHLLKVILIIIELVCCQPSLELFDLISVKLVLNGLLTFFWGRLIFLTLHVFLLLWVHLWVVDLFHSVLLLLGFLTLAWRLCLIILRLLLILELVSQLVHDVTAFDIELCLLVRLLGVALVLLRLLLLVLIHILGL